MPVRLQRSKYFLLLAVAAGWVACRETASPPSAPPFEAGATIHQVRWSGGAAAPRFALRPPSTEGYFACSV